MNVLDDLRNAWLVACTSQRLRRRPLGVVVLGVPVVLFRATGGAPAALVDRCPHRNAALSHGVVRDGTLACGYHGWTFDAAGACTRIPGLAGDPRRPAFRAEYVHAAERDGFVWVNLGAGSAPPLVPPGFAGFDDLGFDRFVWTAQAQSSLPDALENLLDAQHPHFVHAGLVRTARRRRVRVTVRRDAVVAEAHYVEGRVPEGLIGRLFEGRRTASIGRYFPPATAQLEYRGANGPTFVLTAMFTPVDAQRITIHALLATPKSRVPAFLKRVVMGALFAPVLRQDRDVLRRQQANIARFGEARYASSPLDVMRPHIVHFLTQRANTSPEEPFETTLEMEL